MIGVVTLAFTASASLLASLEEELYDATATVAASNLDRSGPLIGVVRASSAGEASSAAARLGDAAFLPEVQVAAARRLQREHPNSGGGLIYAAIPAPGLVRVGARHTDPDQAVHIAQALAEAVVAYLNANRARETSRLIANLRRERRAVKSGSPAGSPRDFLALLSQATVARNLALLAALRRTERVASVVSPAVRPEWRLGPSHQAGRPRSRCSGSRWR